MADFSISFDNEGNFLQYLEDFKTRIDLNPMFNVKIFQEDNFVFFHIKPLIFPLYLFSPIIWILGFAFAGGFNWLILGIGSIPGFTLLLYSKYWYILALYIAKWRGKIEGKIYML